MSQMLMRRRSQPDPLGKHLHECPGMRPNFPTARIDEFPLKKYTHSGLDVSSILGCKDASADYYCMRSSRSASGDMDASSFGGAATAPPIELVAPFPGERVKVNMGQTQTQKFAEPQKSNW